VFEAFEAGAAAHQIVLRRLLAAAATIPTVLELLSLVIGNIQFDVVKFKKKVRRC
jgi:hypothetical protein